MLVSTLTAFLLPVMGVLAVPARRGPDPAAVTKAIPKSRMAIREAEEVGLAKRTLEVCAIVNVSTHVNCRYHANTSSDIVTTFTNGGKHDFTCYAESTDCVNGNCSWDYAENWDCFVNGYYTDNKCTKANLGQCAFS